MAWDLKDCAGSPCHSGCTNCSQGMSTRCQPSTASRLVSTRCSKCKSSSEDSPWYAMTITPVPRARRAGRGPGPLRPACLRGVDQAATGPTLRGNVVFDAQPGRTTVKSRRVPGTGQACLRSPVGEHSPLPGVVLKAARTPPLAAEGGAGSGWELSAGGSAGGGWALGCASGGGAVGAPICQRLTKAFSSGTNSSVAFAVAGRRGMVVAVGGIVERVAAPGGDVLDPPRRNRWWFSGPVSTL